MSLNRGIYILWLMCLLVFNLTYGQQVAMSVQSTGYLPHLYRDEPIAITCTATGYTATDTVRLVNGTAATDPFYGCGKTAGVWGPGGDSFNFPWLTALGNTYCATAYAQSPPFTLSLEGQVSEDIVGLNLNCFAYLDGSNELATDSLTVSEIRVVPPGPLTLTISGDEPKIAEEKPFNFSCSPSTASPGAQPASEYSYEVLRNGVNVASTGNYTPGQADRDGIKLRCTDTVHYDALKDKYPERVVIETDLLKPWYLGNNGEENRDTALSPATDYTLTCDVSGYPVAQITYSWTCDGCTDTDGLNVLVVPKGSRTSGQTDTIGCTANLPPLTPVTITWNITWDDNAPPPTQGSGGIEPVDGGGDNDDNDDNKVLSAGEITGIVVGVFIACGGGGVVVVVVIYKRKNKPSSGDTTDKGGKKKSDKNGKDLESTPMNTQSSKTQSNMPGKPPHQKSTKKQKSEPKPKVHDRPAPPPQPELVYAEVDHSQTKAKFIQPKPNPPPQESVEYACIDINATKNFRTNGDTYENTGNSRGNSSPTIPKSKAPPPPGVV